MNQRFHIAMLIVAILIILLLLCLGGCASKNQSINLVWHDGECLLWVEGISAEQAGNMSKEWAFGDCEIRVDSALGGD